MNISAKITKSLRKEDAQRDWWIVDAEGKTVGRVATEVAVLLRGKHKPNFTPHVDNGDFVVILNAEKVKLEGKRVEMKEYFSHSGYPGGARLRKFKDLQNQHPELILERAVKGMIPKTRLGRQIFRKLKVYRGNTHNHEAQQPKNYEFKFF
ncbi:MAG: 50S ribosomal protein L13 [Ignavibacteria bacterium GWF2_33_9]|nr:MAG: 50S ribosomal protein L13 [Ignavibacteria bacterium GWF2_33_9]